MRLVPDSLLLGTPLLLALAGCAAAPDAPAEPTVLCDDAGWCWFQDERALVVDGRFVVFGSVANGREDPERRGDVQVTTWDLQNGAAWTVELADRFEADDHDAPALFELGVGQVSATWCGHGKDDRMRTRLGARPFTATAWQPEHESPPVAMQQGRGLTYANVHDLTGTVACFCRAEGWDPTALLGEGRPGAGFDRPAGRLLAGPGRPYVVYGSRDGVVHFAATEQHPRDFDNSLYHGTTDGTGRVLRSDGSVAGSWDEPPAPEQLTRVFEGGPDAVAWPCDLELDGDGLPVCVFSVQTDGAGLPRGQGGFDHRYWYARFDGDQWRTHEIAFAGTRLYAGEDDYTGLCAIVPDDPRVVFVSTDADPTTGAPLVSRVDGERHHEIFRGVTTDGGATFTWTAITRDSTADNLRPIVPRWSRDRCVLLWLRGDYRSYTDYDQQAVGLVLPLP